MAPMCRVYGHSAAADQPRASQTTSTPANAAIRPARRNSDGGSAMTRDMALVMTAGNRAHAAPSITSTKPIAVMKSTTPRR